MTTSLLKAKAVAVAVHLSLSLLVFAVALYLILAIWYPGLLFYIDGGWQGVRIMAGVDLVLGPLLTLIVFNPNKSRRETSMDLGLIALLQIGALIWGFWAVNHAKPLALSYHSGVVQSVVAEDFNEQEANPADVEQFGKTPVLVFTREPKNEEERSGIATFEVVAGVSADKLLYLWEPLANHLTEVHYASRDDLSRKHPQHAAAINALPGNLLQFHGRYGSGLIAVGEKGEWLDSLVLERN